MRLLATARRAIEVVVRYENRSIEHKFAPSATVFRVLEWAIGKKGYGLDPLSAAKANLILPGADQPMPRDRTIGSFTKRGEKTLAVDLTLKDLTNGCGRYWRGSADARGASSPAELHGPRRVRRSVR